MANYLIQDTTLTGIADAIRSKTGGTDPIKVADMAAQIAGIVAGGGGSVVAATGKFQATGKYQTINHNLGTVPMVFLIRASSGYTSPASGYLILAMGFSGAAAEAMGVTEDQQYCLYWVSSSGVGQSTPDYTIEKTNGSNQLNSATENSIVAGSSGSTGVLVSGVYYVWYAIGIKES